MNTATPQSTGDEKIAQTARKSRLGRTIVVCAVFFAGCIAIIATAAVLLLSGRPVNAPDWLRDRIEVRINTQLSGATLGFGDLELVVERRLAAQRAPARRHFHRCSRRPHRVGGEY